MPRTETYDLEAELERIDSELDDLADEAAEAGDLPDADRARAQQLERQYVGLEWALHPEDHESREPYESVTISELTAGSYIKAGAQAEADARDADLPAGADTDRLYRVAQAVEDADFLPDGPTFDQTLVGIGGLKPQFFFWLEQRVDDLTTPDVSGGNFAQRVAERTSDGGNNSSSPE